jgi:hypothetical protein
MDAIRPFLDAVRDKNLAPGRLRGVFRTAIGRRIALADGTVLSTGLTWRQLAAALKNSRFDKDLVREIGADPETLSPRDRERFWYSAIGLAQVNSAEARVQADSLAVALRPYGIVVGPDPLSPAGKS